MSKKKHPEHVNHERWLVSYADFITLLFAFFVVLFASGQSSDKKKQSQLSAAIVSAFNSPGFFDPHAKTPPISLEPTAALAATPMPLNLPLPTVDLGPGQGGPAAVQNQTQREAQTQTRIQQIIQKEVSQKLLTEGAVSVHIAQEGVIISLKEGGFFPSGSADVRPEAIAVLNTIAAAIPPQSMRVEGHTDNVPIHTAQFATNWELSTARAATITRELIATHAAQPDNISAAGYAEFRPAASNATEEGRAKNRRVDIVLLRPPASNASAQAPHPTSTGMPVTK